MNELIKISTNAQGAEVVSARELHEFLESKQQFTDWIKNRIEKFDFVENQDFEVIHNFMKNPNGGRPMSEYALSLDMAKEISMLEGNEKGKQARRYFIECEKRLRQVTSQPLSPLDILKQQVALMEAQEAKINEVKEQVSALGEKVSHLDARTQTRPDYMTIIGYGSYRGIKVTWQMAVKLGKTAAQLCKSKNYPVDKIIDQRYGYVGSYPTEILKEAFETTIA